MTTAQALKFAKLKKGEALVLRTCAADLTAHSGFKWPKKGAVTCPDWKATKSCGNGLHGLLWGCGDGKLLNWEEKAVWFLVRVVEADCIDLDGKVKFQKGHVIYSGDRGPAIEYIQAIRPGVPDLVCGIYGNYLKKGNAHTSGLSGSASATGWSGSASATGESGSASATGWSGSASATGWRGSASATGESGSASATGWRGSASATGLSGSAFAGQDGKAAAGKDGSLAVKWFDGSRHRWVVGYVDEDGIKAKTWYQADSKGKLVEVGPVVEAKP